MSRSCIPWSRKLWREGLAVDMGPFKHQSLTTLVVSHTYTFIRLTVWVRATNILVESIGDSNLGSVYALHSPCLSGYWL